MKEWSVAHILVSYSFGLNMYMYGFQLLLMQRPSTCWVFYLEPITRAVLVDVRREVTKSGQQTCCLMQERRQGMKAVHPM